MFLPFHCVRFTALVVVDYNLKSFQAMSLYYYCFRLICLSFLQLFSMSSRLLAMSALLPILIFRCDSVVTSQTVAVLPCYRRRVTVVALPSSRYRRRATVVALPSSRYRRRATVVPSGLFASHLLFVFAFRSSLRVGSSLLRLLTRFTRVYICGRQLIAASWAQCTLCF